MLSILSSPPTVRAELVFPKKALLSLQVRLCGGTRKVERTVETIARFDVECGLRKYGTGTFLSLAYMYFRYNARSWQWFPCGLVASWVIYLCQHTSEPHIVVDNHSTIKGATCAWAVSANGEADEVPPRVVGLRPLQPRKAASSDPDQYLPRTNRREGIPSARSRSAHETGGRPSAHTTSAQTLGKGDDAETTRLCDELSRWSSALEGAERHLGGKSGLARMRSAAGDGGDHARLGTKVAATRGVLEEVSR